MSINAVKGVEIGEGFAAAELSGEANADEMRRGPDGVPHFLSNHAGGILGGISTGQPVVARFAVKPTSSDFAAAPDGRIVSVPNGNRDQGRPTILCVGIPPSRSVKRWCLRARRSVFAPSRPDGRRREMALPPTS